MPRVGLLIENHMIAMSRLSGFLPGSYLAQFAWQPNDWQSKKVSSYLSDGALHMLSCLCCIAAKCLAN